MSKPRRTRKFPVTVARATERAERETPPAGMFPGWQAEQLARHPEQALPPRMQTMLKVYGATPGRKCGDCIHMILHKQATKWFKCDLTVQTGGAGTDWRARWPACGKFEERPDERSPQ